MQDWTEPLPTPAEMARWDRAAIDDLGIPAQVLMENAGRAALATLLDVFGPVHGKSALILAGPGNNGGDAFVLARLLHGQGAAVRVLHTRPKKRYRGETRNNLVLAAKLGLDLELYEGQPLPGADLVVDGLLGTGFSGTLRPDLLALVRAVNELGQTAFVLALDIPSGLDGGTGLPGPEAIRADLTVTFQAAKTGLVLPAAAGFVGRLTVRDIGLPQGLLDDQPVGQGRITPGVFALLPRPDPLMHKGHAGHVLVVGGSEGLTGAPLLAALGALRGGAGLVTLACPADLCDAARAGFPEVMGLPLGCGRQWDRDCALDLAPHLPRFQALVLGPGLGRSAGAARFVDSILRLKLPPLILDADALFHLAANPDSPGLLPQGTVLTPHPGEAARLLDSTTAAVQADRFAAARALAARWQSVVALKGAGTLVAAPDGPVLLCPLASPGLATGGSGDVLAGLLGALKSRGLAPLPSTCLGVYWHGLGGQLLDERFPGRGGLAREIADSLPLILKEHLC